MQAEGFRELLQRAQAGDRQALNHLLGAVRPELTRRARGFTPPDQPDASALDLVQSVCVRIWEKLDQFCCGADDEQALLQFRAWVAKILQRLGLNSVRYRTASAAGRSNGPSAWPWGPGSARPAMPAGWPWPPAVQRPVPTSAAARRPAWCSPPLEKVPGDHRPHHPPAPVFRGPVPPADRRPLATKRGQGRERYHFTLRRLERDLGGLL